MQLEDNYVKPLAYQFRIEVTGSNLRKVTIPLGDWRETHYGNAGIRSHLAQHCGYRRIPNNKTAPFKRAHFQQTGRTIGKQQQFASITRNLQLRLGDRLTQLLTRIPMSSTKPGNEHMLNQTEYPRKILIIDDNEAIHADFRKVLLEKDEEADLKELQRLCFGEPTEEEEVGGEQLHFHLAHAHQGEAGVQMIAEAIQSEQPFDMAFVDMRMPPGWNGIRTIQELWKVDPEMEIVICSAYSDHTWAQITQELGRSHQLLILKKPFDTAEVLQMSLALTEKRRMSRIASLKMEQIAQLVVERTEELRQQKLEVDATLLDLMSLLDAQQAESTTLEHFVI